MLLPQAAAYAGIAGVPMWHALIATLAGLVLYAALGSSRFAVVSPTSSAAAVFASTALAQGTDAAYALVILTGAMLVLAAVLSTGFLAAFVSRPVLRGFGWALSVTIVIRQLPQMTGIAVQDRHALPLLMKLLRGLPQLHPATLALGGGALAVWMLLRHMQTRWRGLQPSVVVLALGMAVSAALPLQSYGVALLGPLDLQGVQPQWPSIAWSGWVDMAHIAPALVLIVFAESWGSIHALALPHGDKVHARRDMAALGISNLACGLLQGLPVGAGFSASSANHEAGGCSKMAGLFTALALALLLWLARGWLALLPIPVLAAIVAGLLSHNLGPRPLFKSLRLGGDAWLALITAAGVLLGGVLFGMLLAVGLSMLLALKRFAKPVWSELGHLPGSHDYLDMAHHPEVQRVPGMLLLRPEEPVFFANAETLFREMLDFVRTAAWPAQAVIVSLEACDALDATSLEALDELQEALHNDDRHLLLARVKDKPRQALLRAGRLLRDATALDPNHTTSQNGLFTVCWSVDDAVQAAQIMLGQTPPEPRVDWF